MSKRLFVIGAGGHGRVAAEAAERLGWSSVAFLDDAPASKSAGVERWPVAGPVSRAVDYPDAAFFVAIGDGQTRKAVFDNLLRNNLDLVSIIHPSAVLSPYAKCGQGVIFCPGAIVNVDAVVGDGVIINTGATVDHDCRLGAWSHICPGANLAGNVTVGEGAWVGIGASVKQGVCIGDGAVVGAGAAVIEDVLPGATVVGVPARSL